MQVLLINPRPQNIHPDGFFPIGLAYLAAFLEQKKIRTKVVDFFAYPDKIDDINFLREEINSFKPDIIGVGCLFSVYFPVVKEICRKIKLINNNLKVVIGGLHPTTFPGEILSGCEYIDFIILGEGEESFVDLCLKLTDGKEVEDIDGLAYRQGGEIKISPKTRYIADLDNLPFPAYHKFNMDNYFYHYWYQRNNRGMSILTSRSCPNRCIFCNMFLAHGNVWRARSPESVLDEMEFLYNEYRIRHFMFMDDNMTLNKQRTMDIFEGIIKRKLRVTFNFPNGVSVNTLDQDIIEAMKKAGCIEISLAIESGSEYIRNNVIKKRLSNKKIFEVIELCNKYHISTKGFFIFGLPGEDRATFDESLSFVSQLRGNRAIDFILPHFATPFPGTALFQQSFSEGLIDNLTVKKLIECEVMPYDKPIIKLKTLSEQDIIEYRNKIMRRFLKQNYLRLFLKYLKDFRRYSRFIKLGSKIIGHKIKNTLGANRAT